MQINDERVFWGKIRLAICRAATEYLSTECTRKLLYGIFSDLEFMIKDDLLLWQVVESAIPEETELFPTGRHSETENRWGERIWMRLSNMRRRMQALEREEGPDQRGREEGPNRL